MTVNRNSPRVGTDDNPTKPFSKVGNSNFRTTGDGWGPGGLSCVGILLKTNTRGGLQKGPKVGNLRRFLSALVFVL